MQGPKKSPTMPRQSAPRHNVKIPVLHLGARVHGVSEHRFCEALSPESRMTMLSYRVRICIPCLQYIIYGNGKELGVFELRYPCT